MRLFRARRCKYTDNNRSPSRRRRQPRIASTYPVTSNELRQVFPTASQTGHAVDELEEPEVLLEDEVDDAVPVVLAAVNVTAIEYCDCKAESFALSRQVTECA